MRSAWPDPRRRLGRTDTVEAATCWLPEGLKGSASAPGGSETEPFENQGEGSRLQQGKLDRQRLVIHHTTPTIRSSPT